MAPPLKLRRTIRLVLVDEDLATFDEFMARENYENVNTCARALLFAGIDAFPKWRIRKEERRAVYLEAKNRVNHRLLETIEAIKIELEDEEVLARNELAVSENQVLNLETEPR